MKKKIFIVAAIILSSRLWGQQQDSIVVDMTELPWSKTELNRVVVTASKYPQKQSQTGKVMKVITRSELEQNAAKTLGEVLNTVAGTTIIGANNTLGTNQTISIRGSSAGNVLILLDGIPVNDPSVITNYFDLNLLPLDQVERIEILKGGQSTLYGSDAVAGVINIISRKPGNKPFSVNANLAGGSYGTFKESVGLQGNKKSIGYSVGYTHLGSNGFSAAYDKNKVGGFDKDGYDQHATTGRLNIAINKKIQAYVTGTYSFYKADLDGQAYSDEKDYTVKNKNAQVGTGLSVNHKLGTFHFNYNFNYVSRNYVDDSIFRGNPYLEYSHTRFIGRTHYAEVYNNWKWENIELLAGVDYRFNNTDQFSLFIFPGFPTPPSTLKAEMSQISPYASVILRNNEGFTAEIGSRWNHHSEYGDNFSFTFNPSLLIRGNGKIFANLYSAYKVPTLYQLFDPSAGNKDLKPEKGMIGEAGGEIFPSREFHARLTGFYRNTKDAIVYTYNTPDKWRFTFNYTYTNGKITSAFDGTGVSIGKDTSYYNLYRIPKNAINLSIGWYAAKGLFLRTQLRSVSKREEFIYGYSPETQKAYATIDLYGEYVFNKKIKAYIDLKNITNKEYFDIPGYNSRKFNFMAGLSFNL
jgi:vitamin B12 transporter